jgi:hypothetical protein
MIAVASKDIPNSVLHEFILLFQRNRACIDPA